LSKLSNRSKVISDLKNSKKSSFIKEPLISIITVVFNDELNLEETILSILNQKYTNMEYVIVDGGSTDGTLDIIRKYDDKITRWISEPDNGISDAFNKGLALTTGTYINFQGSGDILDSPNVLTDLAILIGNDQPDLISGRILRVDEFDLNNIFYISTDYRKKSFKSSSLLWRMSLPHQGLFTHRRFFDKYGLFDIKLTYSMDYELLLRAYKNFPSIVFTGVVSRWRADGLGNHKELEIYKEYDFIKRRNKIEPIYYLKVVGLFILFKHFLKKLLLKCQ
jgi:glycosyltransferase involved in cell wall biosynthesis